MNETTINKKFAEQEEILQQLLEQNKKTQKTLNWLRIIGVIKIVAILAPIIFAIFYLPPFIKNA
ncbi:MAG: hypothetical protein HQ539_01585, partial [Parcubacteria group bacterium]|nr:hypothetical protein [Parcubacteria group bacterium]